MYLFVEDKNNPISYHGAEDGKGAHHFVVHPKDKPITNPRLQTYTPSSFCSNHRHVSTSAGVKKYQCLGHAAPVNYVAKRGDGRLNKNGKHGYPDSKTDAKYTYDNTIFEYPQSFTMPRADWNTQNISTFCTNIQWVRNHEDGSGKREWRCLGHASSDKIPEGNGTLTGVVTNGISKSFHGKDPKNHNKTFYEYAPNTYLPDPKCCTYHANMFCSNAKYIRTRSNGVKEFECGGHDVGPGKGFFDGYFHGFQPSSVEDKKKAYGNGPLMTATQV